MPRKRQGDSSIGRLTPSQKYHRKKHRSRSRSLVDLDRHQVRMTSQTLSQRMLDLEQVDLDLDLLEFLIPQPEQNLDLGLLFKVCNM